MAALTEQNVHSHLRSTVEPISSNVTPSTGLIPPKKGSTSAGGQDDEFMESGTNETIGSTGSKRKRVRHRKKKNPNDENQMNLPNVGASAAAATPSTATASDNLKRNMAPVKDAFEKPQSKFNTHVR